MPEEQRSFWERLFGTHRRTEREEKVLEYISYRVGEGAHLEDVLKEEYVRRHADANEIQEMIDDPKLIHAAHEKMQEDFDSDELKPEPPRSSAT